MQKAISNSGVYLLEIFASKPFTTNIAKYKGELFPKGYYYYSGSAQKNLPHRLKRHIRKDKIVHWHIDHITSLKEANISNIFIFENRGKDIECELVQVLLKDFNTKIIANGFGNGDCHTCQTHLLYKSSKINHNHFISLYQSIASLIPSSSFTV